MRKQNYCHLLAGVLIMAFAFLPSHGFSQVIYVNQNAAGTNNGSSWANAFTNLQNALDAAVATDEIWVAQGVYKPEEVIDLDDDGVMDQREAVFFIPSGVAMYGGFTGTEASVGERNWEANATILSGDIDNNDLNADGNFIAESISDVAGNNSFHVIYTENASTETRLDGFIITAGRAFVEGFVPSGYTNATGGGWYNRLSSPSYTSSPSIVNVSFMGNYAKSEGGAFYVTPGPNGAESSPLIEGCIFAGNESGHSGGAISIGSYNPGAYEPEIFNCQFLENVAYRNGGAIFMVGDEAEISNSLFEDNLVNAHSEDGSTLPGSGGAVRLVASNAVFNKCMFIDNAASGNPTGFYEGGGGGAIYMSTNEPQTLSHGTSAPQFNGCGFFYNFAGGNTAAWGGAVIYLSDGGSLSPFFVNCVFSHNEASDHGGAVAGLTRVIVEPEGFTPALEPFYTNCTFSGNEAGNLGGAIYHSGYEFDGSQVLNGFIENTILWGNSAGSSGDEIYLTGNQIIQYSLVAGSGGAGVSWDTSLGTDGGNNTSMSPFFINADNPFGPDDVPATSDDGLRLYQFSHAVNAGNTTASGLINITEDFAGSNRVQHGVVDMGAYERSGFIIPNFDYVWILNWRPIEPPCLSCPDVWGFLFQRILELEPHFVWKEPGKFIRQGKSAIITGEIINTKMKDAGFKVHLVLEREHDWKKWRRQQGSWFSNTSEAEKVAREMHETWKFWVLSPKSYIKGTGKIEGTLKLKQNNGKEKTGFQIGMGANAMDGDFGMAGYFDYNGKLKYQGKKVQVKGSGSFNFDGVPCEENCKDQFFQKAAAWDSLGELNKQKSSKVLQNEFINIYPVPAKNFLVLESSNTEKGSSVVKILDASGKILMIDKWNRAENKFTLNVNKLKDGLHFIQVQNENGEGNFTERFVKE